MMLKMNFFRILWFILPSLVLISCDTNRVYENNNLIEGNLWSFDKKMTYSFNIDDTASSYNMLINVRNSSDYAYRNLYLFIKMSSPSGKFFLDTAEIQLADKKGRWNGNGIGNIWQNQYQLIRGARFLEEGTYQVEITHGMRDSLLEAISDIGIRIERNHEQE